MDVLKTHSTARPTVKPMAKPFAHPLAKPAVAPNDINHQKVNASDGPWHATLNGARGVAYAASPSLDHKHGVSQPKTLQNATVSSHLNATTHGKFAKILNDQKAKHQPLSEEHKAQLEQKSQMLVNQFFMGSMLKSMRDSPFKSEMFDGGKGGAAYAGLFDQRLAEHSGNRIAKGLVHSMVRQYSQKAAAPTGVIA